ncbi:MAG: hypothetical protein ABW321_14720 [Polyangiales bacterium]
MTDSEISLHATFKVTEGSLKIRYDIQNDRNAPIVVFNRLWRPDSDGDEKADVEGIYRFVDERGVRLFLGTAPLPAKHVFFKNRPEATRVEARGVFGEDLTIALPVTEHSPYSSSPPNERVAFHTNAIELFVGYADATGIKTLASSLYPDALRTLGPEASNGYRWLRSGRVTLPLEAMHQTGELARFVLPEERDQVGP